MQHFRTIYRKLALILAVILVVLPLEAGTQAKAEAAPTASISVSGGTVTQGGSITVTVTVTGSVALGIVGFKLTYDSNYLQYESGDTGSSTVNGNVITVMDSDAKLTKLTYQYTFKALKVTDGTALTLSNVFICPLEGADQINASKSNGTVKINPVPQASTNAYLKSFAIGGAKISPAFNKETLTYTASVDGSVTKLTVTAEPEDSKAKVAKNGTTGLKEGDNTVTVVVTAEDGKTQKTYTIIVNRGKAPTPKPATPTPTPTPPVKASVGDSELEVHGKADAKYLEATDVWQSTIVEYKKCKVEGLKNLLTGETVVEMSDGNLYILDTEKGTAFRYLEASNPQQSIVLVPVDDNVTIPMGYQETVKTLNGNSVKAYVTSETSEYALLYAKDGKGFTGWYQWDLAFGTFQRFNTEEAQLNPTPTPTPTLTPTPEPTEEPTMTPTEIAPTQTVPDRSATTTEKKQSSFMEYALMGTSGLLFVLMLVFLILYLVQKNRYEKRFAPDDTYFNPDDDYL